MGDRWNQRVYRISYKPIRKVKRNIKRVQLPKAALSITQMGNGASSPRIQLTSPLYSTARTKGSDYSTGRASLDE